MDLEKLKQEVKKRINNIKFDHHFYDNFKRRPYLSEGLIIANLKKYENYKGFQAEEVKGVVRYRLGINLSRKYTLVIVIEIHDNYLNIITSWKTDKKWQKATLK